MSHTLTSASISPVTESIEDIVLRHSGRGMNILPNHLDSHYCRHAAQQILSLPRGTILLTTGFYVAGHPETDGPLVRSHSPKHSADSAIHRLSLQIASATGFLSRKTFP